MCSNERREGTWYGTCLAWGYSITPVAIACSTSIRIRDLPLHVMRKHILHLFSLRGYMSQWKEKNKKTKKEDKLKNTWKTTTPTVLRIAFIRSFEHSLIHRLQAKPSSNTHWLPLELESFSRTIIIIKKIPFMKPHLSTFPEPLDVIANYSVELYV